MENDGFGFHFSIFDIDLIATQNNRNILTHTDKISMPIWNVFICDTWRDIKHDNSAFACVEGQTRLVSVNWFQINCHWLPFSCYRIMSDRTLGLKSPGDGIRLCQASNWSNDSTLTFNIVTITKTAKLLLASSVPDVEFDWTTISMKHKWMHFHAKCSYIFLFKFTSDVTFDECSLSSTAIANQ